MKMQTETFLMAVMLGAWLTATTVMAEPPAASATTFDPARYKTADELWTFIQGELMKLSGRFSSKEEAMVVVKPVLRDVDLATAEFVKRFPEEDRRWDARMIRSQVWYLMGQVEMQPFDPAKAEALLNEIVASPDALVTDKADAKFAIIQYRVELLKEDSPKEAFVAANEKIEAFLKDHAEDRRADMVMLLQARVVGKHDPDRQIALLKKLSASPNVRVAMPAQQELTSLQIKKAPLDLKFVDMNGKEVDLAKMRGKVVLIDFWATWCRPCMMDLPNVLAAYQKYKDKGLEIVGISWDDDKDKLMEVLKKHSMTWAQYFEGNGGGQDKISRRFGIMGIPTQWLVDKKGFVRSMDARGDLDSQIAKLVAE